MMMGETIVTGVVVVCALIWINVCVYERIMGMKRRWRVIGWCINEGVSFIVFCFLDVVDVVLCVAFKVADLLIVGEWKTCYCLSSTSITNTNCGGNMLQQQGQSIESKILSLTSSSSSSSSSILQLDDISHTLFSRPSFLNLKLHLHPYLHHHHKITVNSTIVHMLQTKKTIHHPPIPTWSDCHCTHCTSWTSSFGSNKLFVSTQGPTHTPEAEAVLFIHGFISSSSFWTETLFPNFSRRVNSSYRLFAVDLLGFGRSPKPSESLYTVREHLEMLERSVLEPHNLHSFHIVAHSLGCILALALAVQHPTSVKSLTLLAPPYYPLPKATSAHPTQYVMTRVAPRRLWPLITFGASIVCWYEHITRMICFLICKNHRLWQFLTKLITRNRMRIFLLEGFFCHTHNAAWHTLHNIICGTAGKMEAYLDALRDNLNCKVTLFHGKDDNLIPLQCSYDFQTRVPRAHLRLIDNKDHITIVVGRQKAFARELEHIWSNSLCNSTSTS